MKTISLKELKEDLSRWTTVAAKGVKLQVTRYNRPYLYIFGYETPGLYIGSNAGKGTLESVLKSGSKGRFLDVLTEDRNN